ncbi:MFS transporter [Streptoalloteichus hindustanus]|uniref:Predicted arabinose efflux permease, MFS family n=1 Tax=Streptoalloteichus hindustanus TaxID=2017 RepID=A0A1M5BLA9_STRHI|nr:MFS transporter [Streptoalloteichus hindustanus]SHF43226.1 Predicted arabinose efflux permease, MFS family [Streptoalloteichus hindustanus]
MTGATPPVPRGGRGLVVASALCAGVTVGNVYLAQPVLGVVAADLGVPAGAAGGVATTALFGYAVGILSLVPLGDLVSRRRLVTWLGAATVALLAGAAAAPSLPVLSAFVGLAAATTVIPQVLVPLVSEVSAPERRGVALAWVQAGLVTGMMGSRVLSGALGDALGWRVVYLVAAALTAIVCALTVRVLPVDGPRPSQHYRDLLAVLPGLARRPDVRGPSLAQAAVFAGFNAVWTTLALALTSAPHGLSASTAGLVGLLGLAGAVAAPAAGRAVDRVGARVVAGSGLLALLVASPLLFLGGSWLPALVPGVLLLAVGMQVSQVAHQARVMAGAAETRSRRNAVYMVGTFLGGAVGAAGGSAAYSAAGWSASCAVAACCFAAGGLVWWAGARRAPEPVAV